MLNVGLDKSLTRIKIDGRNINNLWNAYYTTLLAKSEEELKRLLMRVKEDSEKTNLKLQIQKMNIMAYSPVTSCQIEEAETVADFIFLGSKITVTATMKLKDTCFLEGKLW